MDFYKIDCNCDYGLIKARAHTPDLKMLHSSYHVFRLVVDTSLFFVYDFTSIITRKAFLTSPKTENHQEESRNDLIEIRVQI